MPSNPVTRIRNTAFAKAKPRLDELAAEVRKLGKRMLDDVLRTGEILLEARSLIGHGHWLKRLAELGLSDDMAGRFMDVSEMSKSRNLRDSGLQLPISAFYILAQPSTPEEARDAVFARSEASDSPSLADVKREIALKKKLERGPLPTPKWAYMQIRADLASVHYAIDNMTRPERLIEGGPLTAFESVLKLLPLFSDDEWTKLETIVRERSTGEHASFKLFKKPPKGKAR
jgi:hypothetical protein